MIPFKLSGDMLDYCVKNISQRKWIERIIWSEMYE